MRQPRDRSDYLDMLGINFLWATATAGPFAVLSLILRDNAIDVHWIGYIMGAATIGMITGSLLSGWAASRYGPLRVVIAAILCTSLALVSFEWTTAAAIPALLSRLVQGLGFGLFMPAGMLYVQSKVPENDHTYAIGLFSAMAIAPYFYAQFLAQAYLENYGSVGIFAIGILPFIVTLILALRLLPREKPVTRKAKTGSYMSALSDPRMYPPYLCMMVNGMLFSFGASFLPILLKDSAILIGLYFTPFAITTLAARFLLMKRLQEIPKPVLLALGMVTMGIGAFTPLISLTATSIIISGVIYGLAYSIIGPTTIVRVGQLVTPAERPRPVALVNTFFQVGAILSPIAASYAFGSFGLGGLLGFMALIGVGAVLTAMMVVFPHMRMQLADTKA